jgi:hypothetical protein
LLIGGAAGMLAAIDFDARLTRSQDFAAPFRKHQAGRRPY